MWLGVYDGTVNLNNSEQSEELYHLVFEGKFYNVIATWSECDGVNNLHNSEHERNYIL